MQLSLLKEALKDVFGLPDAVLNRILDGCDFSDFWVTWYRLWQVYSNVAANGSSDADPNSPDDKDNPESHYNHFNQAHHELLIKSLIGLNIFSFIAKTIQVIYQAYRKHLLNSYSYLDQQLEKISIIKDQQTNLKVSIVNSLKEKYNDYQDDENSTNSILKYLLAKKAACGEKFEIDTQSKLQINLIYKSSVPSQDVNDANSNNGSEKQLVKAPLEKGKLNFINQMRTSTIGKFTQKMWELANGQALIFWIVWMLFNIVFGTKAIDPTPPSGITSISKPVIAKLRWVLTPIIVGITVGVMLIYGIGKGIYQIFQRYNRNIEKDKRPSVSDMLTSFLAIPLSPFVLAGAIVATAVYSMYQGFINLGQKIKQYVHKLARYKILEGQQEEDQDQKVIRQEKITEENKVKYVINELKARYFIKMRHAKFKTILENANILNKDNSGHQLNQIDKILTSYKDSVRFSGVSKEKANKQYDDKIQQHKQKLIDHVFGSIHEQQLSLFNHSLREGVKGFIGASFILWCGSYFISVVATHIGILSFLTGTAIVLTNPILAGIVGLTFVGLFVLKGIAKFKQYQVDYEKKRNGQLKVQYQSIKDNNAKLEYLAKLAAILEAKKVTITDLRNSVAASVNNHNENSPIKLNVKHWQISNYDLDKIDIYNDDYFEKQRDCIPLFTYFKKGLNRTLEFLGGSQTGNFLARALFLAGSLMFGAVSSFANPVLGFFIIAGALGFIVGGNRLADYILKHRQQHRENFNIDVRISYAKKMLKETDDIEKILQDNIEFFENANKQDTKETSDLKPGQKDTKASPSAATKQAETARVHPPVFNAVIDTSSISIVNRRAKLNALQFV